VRTTLALGMASAPRRRCTPAKMPVPIERREQRERGRECDLGETGKERRSLTAVPRRLAPEIGSRSNMHGQPPSMTVMPCSRPYAVAGSETLPEPGPRRKGVEEAATRPDL
jgi:hypothetical protein